ncbi:MAG: hypothetical protein B7X00_00100 [Legionella sp. 21-45-4]|nr:MAG: hypothetical protein B7X00_00100 [Legionella sp. 21-45-4]
MTAACIPLAPVSAVLILMSFSAIAFCYYGLKALTNLIYKLNHAPTVVPCHHPELERNASLDLYRNTMKALFSKDDLKVYQSATETQYEEDDYSILEETETTCTVHATKAKIVDMKRAIYLINFWGKQHNQPDAVIKEAVEKQHQAYLKGLPQI